MTRFMIAAALAAVTATGAFADEDDSDPQAGEATRAALSSAFASAGFGYVELPSFLTEQQAATLMSIMEDPALDNSEREERITQLIEDALG